MNTYRFELIAGMHGKRCRCETCRPVPDHSPSRGCVFVDAMGRRVWPGVACWSGIEDSEETCPATSGRIMGPCSEYNCDELGCASEEESEEAHVRICGELAFEVPRVRR